nr:PfkB family carbohydrate kinase [Angustibacter aerolatus]
MVVGSLSADVTAFAPRLPGPGETVLGSTFSMVLGGKGANQAVAAARAGAVTAMVGCVGDDLFRDLVVDGLRAEGVGTDHLRTVSGPTGIAHIRVDAAGQNDIVVVPLANAEATTDAAEKALRALAPGAAVLLLRSRSRSRPPCTPHGWATSSGSRSCSTPRPPPSLDHAVWAHVDVVTPNETEARRITGCTDVADAGRWFVERGARTAVVTVGGDGAVVVDARCTRRLATHPVTPVDTTAAGDAFAGHLGAALAAGAGLDDALRRALAAGALAVTVAGASPSLPTAAAVDALLGDDHPAHEG